MTRTQRAYFQIFVLALLICWSPAKALAYLSPLLCAAWLVAATGFDRVVVRNLCAIGLAWAAWISLLLLFTDNFALQNAVLAFVTLSSFYVPLAVPSRSIAGPALPRRMIPVLLAVVGVESVIGIFQALNGYAVNRTFDIANGDVVEGTIHLALESAQAFDNPMFSTNIAFALLGLSPLLLLTRRRGLAILWLGGIALVLASVMHLLFFLLLAIAASAVLFRPGVVGRLATVRGLTVLLLLLVVLPLAVGLLLPANVTTVLSFYDMSLSGDNPKVEFARRLTTTVRERYPRASILGFGPGQFASRAALIASGLYLGGPDSPRPLSFLDPVRSEVFDRYLLDLWLDSQDLPFSAGSTLVPFSSWLALLSEAGWLGAVLVFAGLIALLLLALRRAADAEGRLLGFSFGAGLLLLALLGAQELYWEVPQAIFPGCLILKVLYANLSRGRELVPLGRAREPEGGAAGA